MKRNSFCIAVGIVLTVVAAFVAPARVVNGRKVVQTGTLVTGQTIGQYLAAHGNRALVTFRNSDGTLATFGHGR